MNHWQNIKMALSSIRSNLMRSVLAMMIIAFGIMALVGILTAIDTILYSMNDNFSSLGSNAFGISRKYENVKGRFRGHRRRGGKIISYHQAIRFKDKYEFAAAKTSISFRASSSATVKYQKEKTNPTIRIRGIDDNYFYISNMGIESGRNFSSHELNNGVLKVIVGSGYVDLFFNGQNERALNKTITIDNQRYEVIGVLKSRGASMNSNADMHVFIPLIAAKKIYGSEWSNYFIDVMVPDVTEMPDAIAASIGVMRNVRHLKAAEDNDFQIKKSDGVLSILKDITFELRMAAIIIGLMTLLGAAIGLMNIMLQSVTDRTREIGIIKALGATKRDIVVQFLTEAIVISIFGGLMGIVFGVLVGNIVTWLIGGHFLMPWAWSLLGMVVCLIVGLSSGWYPAFKAANLDPIDALRYE